MKQMTATEASTLLNQNEIVLIDVREQMNMKQNMLKAHIMCLYQILFMLFQTSSSQAINLLSLCV